MIRPVTSDAEIIERYRNGERVRELARSLHCGTKRISEVLRAEGILNRRQRPGVRSRLPYRKPSRWTSPPATVSAYVAGIVDGEGWITKERGKWRVSACQLTEAGLCEALVMMTGVGSVQSGTTPGETAYGKRPMSRWIVARHAEVVDLLQAITPFMIVKRSTAEAALLDMVVDHPPAALPR